MIITLKRTAGGTKRLFCNELARGSEVQEGGTVQVGPISALSLLTGEPGCWSVVDPPDFGVAAPPAEMKE